MRCRTRPRPSSRLVGLAHSLCGGEVLASSRLRVLPSDPRAHWGERVAGPLCLRQLRPYPPHGGRRSPTDAPRACSPCHSGMGRPRRSAGARAPRGASLYPRMYLPKIRPRSSGVMLVFVEDAAEAVAATDVESGEPVRVDDRCRQRGQRAGVGDAVMRAVAVVEDLVLA
jgi:hypothetical protein